MTSPETRVPVDAIRRAAALAVEATSLRAVARQVGMSPVGLRHFLNGRAPYSATLRKLTQWFVLHGAARPEFADAAARASVQILLEAVPEAARDAAARELLSHLDAMHRQRRIAPPRWLRALRGEDGSS